MSETDADEAGRTETLEQRERQLRTLIDGSIQGILVHDETGRPLFVNQAFAQIYGFESPDEVLKLDSLDHLIPQEDRERILSFRRARIGGEPAPEIYEARRLKRDGTAIWLDNRSRLIEWNGRPAIQAVVVDITERKLAENALRASEAALAQASRIAKLGHYVWSASQKRLLSFNRSYLDILGLAGEPPAGSFGGLEQALHPEDRERVIRESLAGEQAGRGLRLEYRVVHQDGSIVHVRELSEPGGLKPDGTREWFGTIQDISDIRKAEEERRQSEERLRTIADNIPGVVFRRILGPDGGVRETYVSPRVRELLGVDAEEFIEGRVRLFDFLHPDDRRRKLAALREAGTTLAPLEMEIRKLVRPGGDVRWWQIHSRPTRLPDGTVQFDGVALDVTERHATEEQLKQALKMEAMGHLTGGIAHDFNNLLTVIMASADELGETVATDPARRLLDTILSATQTASELTARLLAFARKQPLDPRTIDLNELLRGLKSLLQRTLGEGLAVEIGLPPDLGNAYVDGHQLEAAILNLAINSRDAMKPGGRVTIGAANVELSAGGLPKHDEARPGSYVAISVADDGCGMPPDVLARAIEPFFTTKGMGKGTGLGLSMVHGFTRQSGGHMTIESEVGKGTTIRLYLPRARSAAEPATGVAQGAAAAPGGRETILVVEDNEAVRETAVGLLRRLGYEVIEAADGKEAVEIANRRSGIDLLFTDIVMPGGMMGPAVARELRTRIPALRVLYTSGYSEDAITHHGKLDEGVALLQKPYRRQALAQKIRAVLDSP